MKSYLGNYLKEKRLKQKLNTAQLAGKIGYKNINKGMRRIIDLEREGRVNSEILRKIIYTLKLDEDIINKLIRKDREAYEADLERWLNDPINMYYTIRVMPAVYLSYDLPSNITSEDEAVEYVSAVAKDKKCLAWLSLSRRETLFIDQAGMRIAMAELKADYRYYSYLKVH